MAEYMILIYDNEAAWASAGQEEFDRMLAAHNRFQEQVAQLGGTIVSSKALQPSSTATTVRGDVVTDGPFAETKEGLGGYYLVDVEDEDRAVELARQIPDAGIEGLALEVRPVMFSDGFDL